MLLIVCSSRRLEEVNIFINDSNMLIKNSFIKNLWLMQKMERLVKHSELSAGLGRGWDHLANWTLSRWCCETAQCFFQESCRSARGGLKITVGSCEGVRDLLGESCEGWGTERGRQRNVLESRPGR